MFASRTAFGRPSLRRAATVLALTLLGAVSARAQPFPLPTDRAPATAPSSLRSRLGVEAVRPWLRSDSTELRLRAFERLGATGSSGAIELLVDALEPGGVARNPPERLGAVRALAPYAAEESARGALVRAMGGALTRDEPAEILVRQTAALALSRSRSPGAVQALAQALRQPGRISETARLALRAHPPKDVGPLLAARGVPTSALAGLLGDLRDPRGRELLATLARAGAPAVRAEALLALEKLDRPAARALALSFWRTEKHRSLRLAATRVLALTHDSEAPAALGALLAEPPLSADALSIALDSPGPALAPVLVRFTPSDPGDSERLFAALGRAGGAVARKRLEQALAEPDFAWAAAYALALSPDPDAAAVLERALARPASRREAIRAGVLRQRAQRSTVDGLDAAIKTLETASNAADRALAAWCRSTLDAEAGALLVKSRDAALARAASRAALDPEVARAAATRLAVEADPWLRASLALSLADPAAAELVPNDVLVALLETHGAAAPLAAFALAARDGDELRPRLRELLASNDPVLRAHVALGLAKSQEPSAVGLLDDAYRDESDPLVRRALVRALGARREPGRARTLRLAADLDPDDLARSAARRALGPSSATSSTRQPGAAWVRVTGESTDSRGRMVVLFTSTGLGLPLAVDPDGMASIAGLPAGPVSVTLASPAPGGDSPAPGQR